MVGDDDQSIYSWRGALIRNILEFDKDYAGAKVVKLEQNYRCTKSVLGAAGRLIAKNEMRGKKTLWTCNPDGEPVHFQEHANEIEEAQFIVGEIQRLKDEGKSLRDFTIFYRTNAQSRVFEDALRRAVVPYTIVGALKFYERMEIKDALAYARVVVNPRDNLALKRILNVPARGLGKTALAALDQYAATQGLTLWEACSKSAHIGGLTSAARLSLQKFVMLIENFRAREKDAGAERMIRQLLEESGYWSHVEEEIDSDPMAADRLDNLQELVNAAKDFEDRAHAEERPATLTVYLEEVSLMTNVDALEGRGGFRHAHDGSPRQGSGVPRRFLKRSGGRSFSHRGFGVFPGRIGRGAPARLRGHDTGQRTALFILRGQPQALRRFPHEHSVPFR